MTTTHNQTGQVGRNGLTDPLDVPCTYCHQPPGKPCRQSRHRWYGDLDQATVRPQPHAARVRLAVGGWTVRHHDGYPVAEPIRVVHDRSVEVCCPECAGTHWHGWAPDMDDRYSHCVSHCHRGDGYVIAPTGDLT